MYLRIVNNTTTYPYTIKNLRDSLPNVSLPANLSNEQLVEWDMYEVQFSTAPNDYTKNIIEGTPTLIDGNYYQNWIQTDANESEIQQRLEDKWFEVREIRNQLLMECDWTQLSDIPIEIKNLWSSYRQDLRDITNQTNPFNIIWPVKP
jgi:Phage tail assembly chaperone protein